MTRAQRDIPPDATVAEAIAEMERAVTEDPDANELLMRVAIIQSQNRGFIATHLTELDVDRGAGGDVYARAIPGRPLNDEELELLKQLASEIDHRLPPGISPDEREDLTAKLLAEDGELRERVAELKQATAGSWINPSPRSAD